MRDSVCRLLRQLQPVNRNRAAAEKPLLVHAHGEWFTHFAY